MTICFFSAQYLPTVGGVERYTFNLARRVAAAGHTAIVVTSALPGLPDFETDEHGIRIYRLPVWPLMNGRFPVLTAMISLFFLSGVSGGFRSFLAALFLTAFLLLGVAATLCSSWLLSRTLLKGLPSSFTLELPCYRRPQVGKVLIRSLLDRTVFVLGRAAASAIPAGVLIWTAANLHLGGQSLLAWLTGALDPLGRLMGLDGVILAAFLLGFPANEIVLPIILMAYLQTGTLVEMSDLSSLYQLLTAHGWTWQTALSMMLFCLFHWPCATTCLTIKKETGSLKWTAAAIALPTLLGFLLCTAVHFLCRLLF